MISCSSKFTQTKWRNVAFAQSCAIFSLKFVRKDSNAKMRISLTLSVVLMSFNLVISIFKCKYLWRISNATKSRSFHYFANKLKKQFHSESLLEFLPKCLLSNLLWLLLLAQTPKWPVARYGYFYTKRFSKKTCNLSEKK